ncbi:MAG: radical SAM protein [Candidatus Kapaibacterium sp.]
MNELMTDCTICPHECHVDRTAGDTGDCGASDKLLVASHGPHYGEEPEIVGNSFSGTIFFSGCNLTCEFCQNYDISQLRAGRGMEVMDIVKIMLSLGASGAANINFVTPTHFTPQLIEAIRAANARGLGVPIVWNSSGYEKPETLRMLRGLVDIYMPDFKYISSEKSESYSGAADYFEYAGPALMEMHAQAGDLEVVDGQARRGLLVRHLVLPGGQSDTRGIIDFIAENFGTNTYLNLMDQYRPCYHANRFREISQPLERDEFAAAVDYARRRGFTRPDYLYS